MISIKNNNQINSMRIGGKILARALRKSMDAIKPGVTEIAIDKIAEDFIRENGGEPGFMKVEGYRHTICSATNDVIVHGIPSSYKYKLGDVACVDCGVYLDGLHTDMADTILVSNENWIKENKSDYEEKTRFLETGKKALVEAIAVAKAGNRIGHISEAIQSRVENAGYSVVRSLIGHGVGEELHEEPEVPGYLDKSIIKTPLLKSGMTIAIEIIYSMGGPDVVFANNDGWTIKTKDSSLSAVFERTVLITESGPEVLTV